MTPDWDIHVRGSQAVTAIESASDAHYAGEWVTIARVETDGGTRTVSVSGWRYFVRARVVSGSGSVEVWMTPRPSTWWTRLWARLHAIRLTGGGSVYVWDAHERPL